MQIQQRQGEAEDYMAMAKRALAGVDKGMLGFGTGVSYASAPAGAMTYTANALVAR